MDDLSMLLLHFYMNESVFSTCTVFAHEVVMCLLTLTNAIGQSPS